jgi:hypothetical protein
MSERIALGHDVLVRIEKVNGDLRLVGLENEELAIRVANGSDLKVQQEENRVSLTCQDDLVVRLPRGCQVQVGTVNGDVSVRDLAGALELEAVHGDLAMRDVGEVRLGTVDADFSLRRATGDVHARGVGGDACLRELEGGLKIDSISDDLALRGVRGDLEAHVDGDVVLHLDPQADRKYTVTAGDDIMLLLPTEANATLTIQAEAVNLEWPGMEQDESGVIRLGEGAAQIKLEAKGDVVLTNRLDVVQSADEYGNFAGMMFDWGGFGRDLGERISRRADQVAERLTRKAEKVGRRAGRHIRRGPHGRVEIGRWKREIPSDSSVSDEERMAILCMLAEKKISAEQAESLLSALEGGA